MQLKDIIAQQPDPSFKLNQTICPYCNGTDVKERGKETTCVGHLGTRPEDDPNHVWVFCECQKCMKEFTKEYKLGNVWYTSKGRVLKGMSNCFESYIYTCKACGGDIRRHWVNRDGTIHAGCAITYGKQAEVWQCQKCGSKTDPEFYDAPPAEIKKLKGEWTVEVAEDLQALHGIDVESGIIFAPYIPINSRDLEKGKKP